MEFLALIFGGLVGLSLGLTGGGGAIFAVPLLVYGLGTAARPAVAISLASVGATSFVGFLHRMRVGEVEVPTGILFALAGMFGAPVGTWLARQLPDTVLMTFFAVLMIVVAVRMWRHAARPRPSAVPCAPSDTEGPTCRRDEMGRLALTSRCAVLMLLVGLSTGILSGIFGVGGGFVIVPALVLFSGMPVHKAVGTSLMVIALVSISGIVSQLVAGQRPDIAITGLFIAGGIGGLLLGQHWGRRLSGPALQKVFAIAILLVALFIITKNVAA